MRMMDSVTVIVPIYNKKRYLRQCIDSILNQTYPDLEILLVDDGSTDGSSEICDRYMSKAENLRVIHTINNGASHARKVGVFEATGEYIMFVDADDWIDPNCISTMIQAMKMHKTDMVCCSYVREHRGKSMDSHLFSGDTVFRNLDYKNVFYRRFFGLIGEEMEHPEKADSIVSSAMKLYPTNVLRQADFIDTWVVGSGEDILLNISALVHLNSACYVDQCFYHYRKDDQNSLTYTYRPELAKQWAVLYQQIKQYISQYQLSDLFENALSNRIAIGMIGFGLNEISAPNKTRREKMQQLRNVLEQPAYLKAFSNLDFQYLHGKWKLFFKVCKYRQCFFLMIMLQAMQFLRKHRAG